MQTMLSANERKKLILERLTQALDPQVLDIIDESEFHKGHSGAKSGASHFYINVISNKFNNLTPIQRHQLIYKQLEDLIPKEIHALRIKALGTS